MLLLWIACSSPVDTETEPDVEAYLSTEVSTVIHVRWWTDESSVDSVEFGQTEDYGFRTTAGTEAVQEHAAVLLGMPALTQVHYRILYGSGETSRDYTIETGPLPNSLPSFELTGESRTGFTSIPLMGAAPAQIIVNGAGDIVWYAFNDEGVMAFRNRISLDGSSLLHNWKSTDFTKGSLFRLPLDGSEPIETIVPGMSHDFVELPGGTIAALVLESQVHDGQAVWTDTIVEIAPDGTTSRVWDAFAAFQDRYDPSLQGDEHEWPHANALTYDAESQAYYVSLLALESIVKVSRDGVVEWELSGQDDDDFLWLSPPEIFTTHKHQFQIEGTSFLVFINGDPGGPASIAEFELDQEERTIQQRWVYPSTHHVFALGDVTRINATELQVTWATAGALERLVDGEVVWSLQAPLGEAFGYSTYREAL